MENLLPLITASEVREKLQGFAGVTAVGVGLKEVNGQLTPRVCMRVYVRRKLARHTLHLWQRIPPRVLDFDTDVIEMPGFAYSAGVQAGNTVQLIHTRQTATGTQARFLHNGQCVVLTCSHLFGEEAAHTQQQATFTHAGQTATGELICRKLGAVNYGGRHIHVDCAVVENNAPQLPAHALHTAQVSAGESVYKTGGRSGHTQGLVVDHDYQELAKPLHRLFTATHQLLIKPVNHTAFSVKGDSGAIVTNATGKAVGQLWGISSNGYALASPILPVLQCMNIELLAVNEK
ncbi:MAG: hypothetical protein IM638_10635 [Bacteroidetes bacterium]|nr:hypothetical protein [Bacteroidota bacterium]